MRPRLDESSTFRCPTHLQKQLHNGGGVSLRAQLIFLQLLENEGRHLVAMTGEVSLQTPAELHHALVPRHQEVLGERYLITGEHIQDDATDSLHMHTHTHTRRHAWYMCRVKEHACCTLHYKSLV